MSTRSQIYKNITKLQKVVQETNEKYAEKLADEVLMICIKAVDRFYNDYPDPEYYDRLGPTRIALPKDGIKIKDLIK